MKIPKLFKKAAAFVMAAVTALSIMPATAFAAGDIGTISFSHTYDSNGNAMRYNSSANIGGYTAGGTGNYKYRMFVDGENAFCIQPGVPLKTGNTLKKASSDTWNALSANQKKVVGLALLYGYQGNRNNLSGSDDEKWLATQTLVWEFVTGCREATGSYNQTSTTVYSLHFGSNYANSGARAVYDQIVAMLREHNTIPSFMSGGKNDITKELAYKDGKYSITLTDSNGVLSDYSFSSSDSNVSVSKSGNKLTISSTVAISGSVRITAKRNNVPTVSSSAKLIAYGDPNLQDLVTGVENADTVSAYINIETPTGTIALKKTSEDGVVEGISFTIKGDNFNKTVKTGKDGSVSVEGLFPGTYTVTEQSIDRYEPQKTQTVTLIGGKTSTVTFSNTLKRGSLEIVKTSEDNLVEGMKFHLYGTSLSGLPVDEYAVTDKNGLAKFENVLISGDTPYVVEEVDTAVRYVVPASQTAPIEWNKVTKRSFDNVLKKFQVTVTKTDAETGSPQGDASLAGAVYSKWKANRVYVNKDAQKIIILEPSKEYTREDGTKGISYNAKVVYDISETSAKDRQQEQEPKSMRELVSALIDASPVPCVPVGELELPAYYDSSQQTIFVKKGLSEEVLFVSMAKEVSAAVYNFKHNESRDASDFKSFCVAYMVSSRYGVDTRGFDFSRLPREYAEMDTQAFKGELGTMRDVLGEIQSDMYKSMEKNKPAKNKEQER